MPRQRVLAVGTAGGALSLCFVEEEPVALVFMYTQRLFRHAVSHLAFSDSEAYLAAASSAEPVLYVLGCNHDPNSPGAGGEHFRVSGGWRVEASTGSRVVALAWQGSTLLYADSAGYLYGANAASEEWAPEAVGEPLVPLWRARLDVAPPVGLVSLPGKVGAAVVGPNVRLLHCYKTPGVGDLLPQPGAALPLMGSAPASANEQPALCLALSHNGRFLAAGGADGSVALFWLGDGKQLPKRLDALPTLHRSAVVALAFSRKSGRLYSAGLDGEVFQMTLDGAEPDKNTGMRAGFDRVRNQFKWQNINGAYAWRHEHTWAEVALQKLSHRKSNQHETHKSVMRQKLLRYISQSAVQPLPSCLCLSTCSPHPDM
jgi:hypothetical protein